jgi:heme-degrading monooxygenase HmoA
VADVDDDPPFQLAQTNIGRARWTIDDKRMAGFVARLAEINELAEAAPGFVWRLKDDSGNATHLEVTGDPRVIINLSVWRSVDDLKAFTYRSAHVEPFQLRHQWFELWDGPHLAAWWVPAGRRPTIEDALTRLDLLARLGPTPEAFTIKQPFPPPGGPAPAAIVALASAPPATRPDAGPDPLPATG